MKRVFLFLLYHLENYIKLFLFAEKVEIKVKELIESIENHLNDNRKGERIRNGVRVAIIGIYYHYYLFFIEYFYDYFRLGKPNAGKSSLLNSLIKRRASIVLILFISFV